MTMLLSQPAMAQQHLLQPAGEWAIANDDESCTLSRSYTALGEGDTTLYLRSYGPYAPAQVSINGPTIVRDQSRSTPAQIHMGENERDGVTAAIATTFRDLGMLVFQAAIYRPGQNQANSFGRGGYINQRMWNFINWDPRETVLHLDAPEMDALALEINSMGSATELLLACEQELVASWGFDTQQQASLSRLPELINRDRVNYWIIYPPNLMLNRISRIVQFRLRVDENGEVDDCTIQAPSWDRRVLRQSCRAITQGAEFTPALDANGVAVPSLWRATMIFVMED